MLSLMAFGQPEPIRIAPSNTLFERVASLGTLSHFAVEMVEPAYEVLRYLPQDLLKGHIYIIVRALNAGKLSSCCRHSLLCCTSFDAPT
jgi:hypothetical protein